MKGLLENASEQKANKTRALDFIKDLESTTKPCICIVEDDSLLGQQLCKILEKENFLCRHYSSPVDFLKDISDLTLLALVLDIRLPGMSGIDVLKNLEPLRQKKPFAIFIMTGDSQKSTVEAVAKSKVNGFFVKPLSWEILVKEIKKHTHKPKD